MVLCGEWAYAWYIYLHIYLVVIIRMISCMSIVLHIYRSSVVSGGGDG